MLEVASVGWLDYGRSILLGVIVSGVYCWTFCYFVFGVFWRGDILFSSIKNIVGMSVSYFNKGNLLRSASFDLQ